MSGAGGVVTLDGHDLKTVSLEHLRRAVGIVDQEPCILHASIAENIRYAKPDATDDEVRAAARQAVARLGLPVFVCRPRRRSSQSCQTTSNGAALKIDE